MSTATSQKKKLLTLRVPIYMLDEIDVISKNFGIIKDHIISKSLDVSFNQEYKEKNITNKLRISGRLNLLLSSSEFSKKRTVKINPETHRKLKSSSNITGNTIAFEAALRLADQGFNIEVAHEAI